MIRKIQDLVFFKKVIQWQINLDIASWNYWYPKEKIKVITEKEYKEGLEGSFRLEMTWLIKNIRGD